MVVSSSPKEADSATFDEGFPGLIQTGLAAALFFAFQVDVIVERGTLTMGMSPRV